MVLGEAVETSRSTISAPTGCPALSRWPVRSGACTVGNDVDPIKLDKAHARALKPILQMTFTTGMTPS